MKTVAMVLKGDINFDARVQKFISSLVEMGFQVTLIVWNWQPITFTYHNLQIIELDMSGHKIPTRSFMTFLLNLKFCYQAAQLIKKLKPNYCHFNDLDSFISTIFFKKKDEIRFIYDAHELFPECQTNRLKRMVWNFLEKWVVQKADTIIHAEVNRAQYFQKKYHLKDLPCVINNFPRFVEVNPEQVTAQREKLGLTGKKILVYQGIIGPDRFVREMILSLKYLPESYVFLLIGITYGNYETELRELVRQENVEHRVIFYGKVSPRDMVNILAVGEIGLAFYTFNTLNDYYCAPNKIFDYLMAGLAIVTNRTPALEMLKDIGHVAMVDKIQPQEIANAIQALANSKINVSPETQRAFAWEALNKKIMDIYHSGEENRLAAPVTRLVSAGLHDKP